jgi:hypothetical protein
MGGHTLMGYFKTDLVWGRNSIYVWDCKYCGKHHEEPRSLLSGKTPLFCNGICHDKWGGKGRSLKEAKKALQARYEEKTLRMYSDYQTGKFTKAQLAKKYGYKYTSNVNKPLKRAREILGIDNHKEV